MIALEGPDTHAFLQGLISNDLDRMASDRALYAALLTPQGKFLFELILARSGERVLIDTERDRVPALIQRLMLYRLRAAVEIADVSDDVHVAALLADDLPARLGLPAEAGACRAVEGGGLVMIDPRLPELGGRALLGPDVPPDRL
ncbi:MAG: folate-binding protein, partial [Geminicoccaceae bacterium]|nr:folate-binding protein [Geminicoccaceae bacterium]